MLNENDNGQVGIDYEIEYYKYIYDNKISETTAEDCVHRHHIIPKCLGGSDDFSNIALLKPKDHAYAHVLMFKMMVQKTVKAAHAVVSMIGEENLDDTMKLFNSIDEYDIKMTTAIKALKKRTIVDVVTFDQKTIGLFENIPDGFVERISVKGKKKSKVYNINNVKEGLMLTWPEDAALPCKDWRWYKDADIDIKLKLNPKAGMPRYSNVKNPRNNRAEKLPMRYVHNIQTNKNVLILKDAPLPAGFEEGMYLSEESRRRLVEGGKKSAQINKDKYSGKEWRWVFDLMTLKNKLVEKDAPLPRNCLEGMKDVTIDMASAQEIVG